METIKNYLETMFAQLPQTSQILELKEDLLLNMEEKYHELKNEGKSENEAIGIVISEFGNIDELISELGLSVDSEAQAEESIHIVHLDEALSYLEGKKKTGHLIGSGVALILIGVCILIGLTSMAESHLLGDLSEDIAATLGVIGLILFIVPAVGLFIYSGTLLEKYQTLKDKFKLENLTKERIQKDYDSFLPALNRSIIIGVSLCIFSAIPVIAGSLFDYEGTGISSYLDSLPSLGVIVCLLLIAIAVYLFVSKGSIKEAYHCLLELEDFSPEQKDSKSKKIIGAVASVVWPLAVCIFLLLGFLKDRWDIAWIVFPITGILFGMFSSLCTNLLDETKHL